MFEICTLSRTLIVLVAIFLEVFTLRNICLFVEVREYFFPGVIAACILENLFRLLNRHSISRPLLLWSPRLHYICNICQKFLPDIFILGIIQLLRSERRTKEQNSFYRFILIQFLFTFSLSASILQKDGCRGGVWRRVIEWGPIVAIGYCSYPLYLFQQVLLNFYGHILYDDMVNGAFPVIKGGSNPEYEVYWKTWWMADKPLLWKGISVPLLIVICYLIQKYFQDGLVIYLTNCFLRWWRNSSFRECSWKLCWRRIYTN